jgi:transcriptional regulator with XRE-family HTH domain
MTIGVKIQLLRQEKDRLQAQLSNKLNTHPKPVSAYERGRNLPSTCLLFDVNCFNALIKGDPGRPSATSAEYLELGN